MKRVKMLQGETGRHPGFGGNHQYHCRGGHEYDVPADLAKAWIAKGIAVAVKKKSSKATTQED